MGEKKAVPIRKQLKNETQGRRFRHKISGLDSWEIIVHHL